MKERTARALAWLFPPPPTRGRALGPARVCGFGVKGLGFGVLGVGLAWPAFARPHIVSVVVSVRLFFSCVFFHPVLLCCHEAGTSDDMLESENERKKRERGFVIDWKSPLPFHCAWKAGEKSAEVMDSLRIRRRLPHNTFLI